jgi:hypothetical protein
MKRLVGFLNMLSVRVFVKSISAENFWEIGKLIPPVQMATNLNVVGINRKSDDMLEVPFVFTINYSPGVAQISMKGKSHVRGSKDELRQILKDHKEKKSPSPIIIQSISNVVFLESVIICKTLNIPPPIPLPKISPTQKKERSEPTYRA